MDGAHSAALAGLLWLPVAVPLLLLGLRVVAVRFEPAARLLHNLSTSGRDARIASLALLASAAVHLALVPGHLPGIDHGFTGGLFLADGVALCAAAPAPFLLARWRALAGSLFAINLAGYALYLGLGWESIDVVGLLTKALEYLGLLASLVQTRPLRSLGAHRIGVPRTSA